MFVAIMVSIPNCEAVDASNVVNVICHGTDHEEMVRRVEEYVEDDFDMSTVMWDETQMKLSPIDSDTDTEWCCQILTLD